MARLLPDQQGRYDRALEQFRLVEGYVNALPWTYHDERYYGAIREATVRKARRHLGTCTGRIPPDLSKRISDGCLAPGTAASRGSPGSRRESGRRRSSAPKNSRPARPQALVFRFHRWRLRGNRPRAVGTAATAFHAARQCVRISRGADGRWPRGERGCPLPHRVRGQRSARSLPRLPGRLDPGSGAVDRGQ